MNIITEYVNPPIPGRHFDWSAHLEGYEPGDPIATRAEAISDLQDQLAELHAERDTDDMGFEDEEEDEDSTDWEDEVSEAGEEDEDEE